MKVERVGEEDIPFVCITLTRNEAKVLFELVNVNINKLKCYDKPLDLPNDANDTFAEPLFNKLENLLGE